MAVTSVIGRQIVDLLNDTNYYFEVAPQGDSQARYVEITVLNDNVPYIIPTGSTIILEGKNAGGYNIFNSCALKPYEENVVVVPLTNGVLSYAGVGKYSVAIYNGNDFIISFPFNIVVTEAPYDIVALKASDSYEALNKMVAKAADSNRWIVEPNDPPATVASDVHKNDLFLNSVTGAVFYAEEVLGELSWQPMINPATGDQLNLMEKTYVRYALDSSGTGMSEQPVVSGVVRSYIGFYNSVNLPPSSDISDPANYKWSLLRFSITNYSYYYIEDTNYNGTPPADTAPWSTTLPTQLTSGACLWTKVVLDLSDGTTTQYYSVGQFGKDAGFGNITSTTTPSTGKPSVTVTMDPTTPNTARDFDFDFKVRGGSWRSGTDITGTGTSITSTTFNDSNTVAGDMYLNSTTGNIYTCTAVTASNSTWAYSFTVSVVSNIDDLSNTRRYYGILTAGSSQINLGATGDSMYAPIQPTDTWDYYWKCYVSRFAVSPKRTSSVQVGTNCILAQLVFNEQPTDMAVCIEIRKIDRPSPTTPPTPPIS